MAFDFIKNFARGIKKLFSSNFTSSIAGIAQNQNITSDKMLEAIDLWLKMFNGNAPWLDEDTKSLNLPAVIASEISKQVTLEMQMTISGSPMADFISEQMKKVLDNIRETTEYACAGGGIVFKPYIYEDGITTEIVHADMFYPFAYNNDQKITGAYFIYRKWEGKKVYSRIEKHEMKGKTYTVTNTAYVSASEDSLGKECLLTDVEEWSDIEPVTVINDIESPLFSYFKIPIGNNVDQKSPLGVSVYSRAVDLIQQADEQWDRLMWEYKGGELAIDATEDAFKKVNGKLQLPEGKERLYRANNLDAATTHGESLMKTFSPALRDANYISGLNRIMIQIENACCLSRGVLSDPTEVEKSATEMRIMKQRSYVTVSDIQTSLQSALDELVKAMYTLAYLYELCPDGQYSTQYVWDDSIIVDAEAERARDQVEVSQGLMMKWEYRVKWYGEDEETAKRILDEAKEKSDDEIMNFINEQTGEEEEEEEPKLNEEKK